MADKRLFFGSQDDKRRAKMFNELVESEETTEAQREKMRKWVYILMYELQIEEAEAKALLSSIIAYESMHADERDFCLRRAEAVRGALRWQDVNYKLPYSLRKKEAVPQ